MDAKEKAEKLFITMLSYVSRNESKQCALIAVDEILEYIDSNHNGYYTMPESVKIKYDYYEEVKQELEKL